MVELYTVAYFYNLYALLGIPKSLYISKGILYLIVVVKRLHSRTLTHEHPINNGCIYVMPGSRGPFSKNDYKHLAVHEIKGITRIDHECNTHATLDNTCWTILMQRACSWHWSTVPQTRFKRNIQ